MDEKIIFSVQNKIGVFHGASVAYLSSQFLNNFKKNREEIQKRSAWKTEGINAESRQEVNFLGKMDYSQVTDRATINGITFAQNGKKIIYSLSVDNYSGIFAKNPLDNAEAEGHIIHNNNVQFYNLDYNPSTEEVAVSLQHEGWERNIAILNTKNSSYRVLTEGDSLDDNPVWGKLNPRTIYYDSAGIGINRHGGVSAFTPRVIHRLDLNTGELDEMVAVPKHDCFLPKVDEKENLYFIKKPHQSRRESASIFDFFLIPFRLLKALYNWIEFFTIRYTGEPLTSGSSVRAKSKQQDPKEVLINGNIINAAKALKENQLKGEKFPGIAPRTWELMKREKNGDLVSIKKGVLDYDINQREEIIYSNGKYLIKITREGTEEVLEKADLAHKIKAFC